MHRGRERAVCLGSRTRTYMFASGCWGRDCLGGEGLCAANGGGDAVMRHEMCCLDTGRVGYQTFCAWANNIYVRIHTIYRSPVTRVRSTRRIPLKKKLNLHFRIGGRKRTF